MQHQQLGIVIQARTGSTRLPSKMLLPFYDGLTILELLIERLKSAFHYPIILATSTETGDDKLEQLASKMDVFCVRGSEENVLSRFLLAAEKYKLSHVVRVCADNPFLDMQLISQLTEIEYTAFDYSSHILRDGTPAIKTHFGFFTELVSKAALENINSETDEKLYQEHVTNYIYSHENKFNIKFLELPSSFDDYQGKVRLTIDTAEDFKIASQLYAELMNSNKHSFDYKDVFSLISEKENIFASMISQIEQNTK